MRVDERGRLRSCPGRFFWHFVLVVMEHSLIGGLLFASAHSKAIKDHGALNFKRRYTGTNESHQR